MISTFTAFFDANVFYGARLRSLVLTLAQTKMFRARWSEHVHDEWMRTLLRNRPQLTMASSKRHVAPWTLRSWIVWSKVTPR